MASGRTTAAEAILLAAAKLGEGEFSEWALTVRAWQDDNARFGMRGFESLYPDHKRTMKEIMGQGKANPLRRGWMERTRPNHYSLTPLGRAEALRLASTNTGPRTKESAHSIYDAICPYLESRTFRMHRSDHSEPKMWLGAASFLGITRNNDAKHLDDRLRAVKETLAVALRWFDEHGHDEQLRRGPTGGGVAIRHSDVLDLERFLDLLISRFERQIAAVRERG